MRDDAAGGMADSPLDPFAGDPSDPAAELGDPEPDEPLTAADREEIEAELEELLLYRRLLGPRGVRGLVVDCDDCEEPHFFAWELLTGNLRLLLDAGQSGVHEPAWEPDPSAYVSWDYARGYADAVLDGGG